MRNYFVFFALSLLLTFSMFSEHPLLDLLQIQPSFESLDFIENKKQFQLHSLLTEQRHPKTWNVSQTLKTDTKAGLEALFSVDEDISEKCLNGYHITSLEKAAEAIEIAILEGKKIYLYGCGATGRLAKQVESCFWRPFFEKLQSSPLWRSLKDHLPQIKERLIGEMTGADRALISSLEGLEDLELIGKLQLEDHRIEVGDVVFAITEGGETSSVIGAINSAANIYGNDFDEAKKRLFFIYNNPDEVLLPLDRSRFVLENKAISKICLSTGPQAITGSTRMQATTSETFVMGVILEQALSKILLRYLSYEEVKGLGLEPISMKKRLLSFIPLQKAVSLTSDSLSHLTDIETETYTNSNFSTYFAKDSLIPVFIDATERAPTFRLFPLDTHNDLIRKSWIQIGTPADDLKEAWTNFLKRPFKGLLKEHYEEPFITKISDPFLQKAALNSLNKAGDEQQFLYDFSDAKLNKERNSPKENDLGVLILSAQELEDLSSFENWLQLFSEKKASIGVIITSKNPISKEHPSLQKILSLSPKVTIVLLPLGYEEDPLKVREQVALKMLLNAHSTAVMTKLGRVVGNTMSNVNPGNLKLIGRATYLIASHVNSHLPNDKKISYEEANSILFNAIDYGKATNTTGIYSEVALCIIRLLETHQKRKFISWEDTELLLFEVGLETYLQNLEKESIPCH